MLGPQRKVQIIFGRLYLESKIRKNNMALAYSNAHKLYRIQPRMYNYTYGMVVRDIFLQNK